MRRLFGTFFGDKGYISKAPGEEFFVSKGLRHITKLQTNMCDRLLTHADKLLLRKRTLNAIVCTQIRVLRRRKSRLLGQ